MQGEPLSKLWLLSETRREIEWWTDMARTGTERLGAQRFARYVRWSGIAGFLGREISDELRVLENALRDEPNSRDDALSEIIRRLQRIEEKTSAPALSR
jgi:hypothetical protein